MIKNPCTTSHNKQEYFHNCKKAATFILGPIADKLEEALLFLKEKVSLDKNI